MNDIIYGKRKQGKSTLALALAIEKNRRVVVFDPNNQFPVVRAIALEDLPDWIVRTRLQEVDSYTGKPVDDYFLVRVGPFNTSDIDRAFTQFSEAIGNEQNISLIVDEAHMLQGSNWLNDDLDRWNRKSSATVAVIQTTHRIVDAHPDSRYHADNIFFFYAYLERELKAIRENFGPDVAVVIPTLKAHQVVHWWNEIGGRPHFSVWPNGEEWFIDLENHNQ